MPACYYRNPRDDNVSDDHHWSISMMRNALFAGYYRDLPGFPRYSVLGSDDSGVFNLQIIDASLEDEAVYECQVGPNGTNKPIRANAKLNVLRKLLEHHFRRQEKAVTYVFSCSATDEGRAGGVRGRGGAGGSRGGGGGAGLQGAQRQAQARHHLVPRRRRIRFRWAYPSYICFVVIFSSLLGASPSSSTSSIFSY